MDDLLLLVAVHHSSLCKLNEVSGNPYIDSNYSFYFAHAYISLPLLLHLTHQPFSHTSYLSLSLLISSTKKPRNCIQLSIKHIWLLHSIFLSFCSSLVLSSSMLLLVRLRFSLFPSYLCRFFFPTFDYIHDYDTIFTFGI